MEEKTMLTVVNSDVNNKPKPLGKRYAVRHKDTLVYKILMCGGSNRGQTSYIQRYITGEFERTIPTIGIDFALKHLEWEDGRHITLQLWDIAGQERTQTMNRMYYQGAHACVIMFDLTYDKSLEICLQWKKDLDSKCTLDNGDPIPCILLGNKSDLTSKRKIAPEEIQRFANENKFIYHMETSVRNNVNVDESMNFLVKNLLEHEHLPRAPQRSPDEPKLDDPVKKDGDKKACC